MNLNRLEKNFIVAIENLTKVQRQILWTIGDALAFIFGTVFAMFILSKITTLSLRTEIFYTFIAWGVFLLLGYVTTIRVHINRYLRTFDFIKLFSLTVFSHLCAYLILFLIMQEHSIRFSILSVLGSVFFVLSLRVMWQLIYSTANRSKIEDGEQYRKVVIMGAGDGGSYFMESYSRNPGNIEIVGILDHDPVKHNKIIGGVRVLGDSTKLAELSEQGVEEVIIAIPSLKSEDYERLLAMCNQYGLKVSKMPKVEEVLQGITPSIKVLPKVDIADLLGRKEVKLDETLLRKELENKTILVTGAGGSIGSEIVRQVSRFNPRRILLLGHGENSIYLIYHEMLKQGRMIQYEPIIADIQDKERLVQIMNDKKPDIVYHAAAHKHVPLMEMNPIEAYKNNIIGTYNVATAVDEVGIKKMVMISSDKAVNPPNVMGASKRVAELIITGIAQQSKSVFCAVRFGNVLGSRGSVIPVFEKQIDEGGPVTVTDFRMTRYFMTIPEASRLVIHAGAFAQSGEVFVLDMGEPVKIVDLAKKLILLSGYKEHEIPIVEAGIRPGEKLFEELLLSSEKGDKQIDGKIFVGNVAKRPLQEIEQFITGLKKDNSQALKEAIVNFANVHEEE
ncbi:MULTISPECIES: nucleoside-diphosphate sugar epimerase/dehydratase [unclassified Facklamia]|uniref:polysaccharide biosynthesis protein n=1 Tax=Aerococcaceae TaxID=186827 RepID=UPI0013B91CB2|nr:MULTISPECIES: nucleoside-diphosphate sugar epimerase/dehydratase [unclassified Facklamia]NEW65064.1 NAD-dependent epimerase/dehydratase family protein [Facklamia sp. 252]NEW68721.1 NAD-dependent epimerase/dehydratase family protein [Facklamia sp. 253]QQD65128.1 polysaccharide biosynthesis protein [Aerococcaceae bacterium zg-252]